MPQMSSRTKHKADAICITSDSGDDLLDKKLFNSLSFKRNLYLGLYNGFDLLGSHIELINSRGYMKTTILCSQLGVGSALLKVCAQWLIFNDESKIRDAIGDDTFIGEITFMVNYTNDTISFLKPMGLRRDVYTLKYIDIDIEDN